MSTAAQTVKRWNMWVVRTHGRQVLCEMESAETPPNGDYVSAEDYTALERRVPTWQPIETAPKGIYVLLFVPGHGVQIGSWLRIAKEWCWSDRADTQPTHWMPLPAPPDAGGTR